MATRNTKTGEFNLDFPGATIICDTDKKRASILNYLVGKQDDFDVNVDFDNKEQAFKDVIFNTTYVHEAKHMHDHLVCPYLAHNTLLKLSALYYAALASQSWFSSSFRYKILPIPFLPWVELPIETKHTIIEAASMHESEVPMFTIQQAANLLDGNFLCEDEFMHNLLLGSIHYSKYYYNTHYQDTDPYNTDYSIRTFTESMAFVQQVTAIALKYGQQGESLAQQIVQDSFNFFIKTGAETRQTGVPIPNKDYIGYTTYTSMFTYTWRFVVQKNVPPLYRYSLIAYLLYWSLSGNVFVDDKKACAPRNRLERLFNVDIQLGVNLKLDQFETISILFRNPFYMFKYWDELISYPHGFTNTRIMYQTGGSYDITARSTPISLGDYYKRILESESQMSNHLRENGFNQLAEYVHDFFIGSVNTIKLLTSNPLAYMFPENYYNNFTAHGLVNIPFRIKFENVKPINDSEYADIKRDIKYVQKYLYGNGCGIDNNTPLVFNYHHYLDAEPYINYTNAVYIASFDSDAIEHILPNSNLWFWNLM